MSPSSYSFTFCKHVSVVNSPIVVCQLHVISEPLGMLFFYSDDKALFEPPLHVFPDLGLPLRLVNHENLYLDLFVNFMHKGILDLLRRGPRAEESSTALQRYQKYEEDEGMLVLLIPVSVRSAGCLLLSRVSELEKVSRFTHGP